jgi:hypothetical protein
LISIDDALRAIAEARIPEVLINLANKAEALRRYSARSRLGLRAQNRCAEIRLRAERKLGQYLDGTRRNSGGRPKPVPLGNGFPTLEDLGITRKLSHRAQRIAAVSTTEFERISELRMNRNGKSPRVFCSAITSVAKRQRKTGLTL